MFLDRRRRARKIIESIVRKSISIIVAFTNKIPLIWQNKLFWGTSLNAFSSILGGLMITFDFGKTMLHENS